MTCGPATMRPAMNSLLSLFTAPAYRNLWRAVLLLLLVTVTWLALSPAPPKAVDTGWDKFNHALAFASLAFVSVWALWSQPRQWGWLVLALLAFGGAIEIGQSYLPPRTADWFDLLADGVGILVGLLPAWPITRQQRSKL